LHVARPSAGRGPSPRLATTGDSHRAQIHLSDLLTYAASQSNAGGSTWYGQVKATQGLAKDTFDAINNQVAFGG